MVYDVFISYSRKDTAAADKIVQVLEEAGITCFIDRQGISGGMEFLDVISNAIEKSKVVLFLASKNSYKSKYAWKEIKYAVDHNLDVIPYIIDGSTMPGGGLGLFLSDINWRDIKSHPIETIVEDVLRKVGQEQDSTIVAGTNEPIYRGCSYNRSHLKSNKKSLMIILAIAVVCSIVVFFTVLLHVRNKNAIATVDKTSLDYYHRADRLYQLAMHNTQNQIENFNEVVLLLDSAGMNSEFSTSIYVDSIQQLRDAIYDYCLQEAKRNYSIAYYDEGCRKYVLSYLDVAKRIKQTNEVRTLLDSVQYIYIEE